MARILVAAISEGRRVPRPGRIMRLLLAEGHEVAFLGYEGAPDGVRFFPLARPAAGLVRKARDAALLATRQYRRYMQVLVTTSSEADIHAWAPDLVLCHDLKLMPLVLRLAPPGRIVLDLREYYPEEFGQDLRWRLLFHGLNQWLCRAYAVQADRHWTVSSGLARMYRAAFGIEAEVLPSVPDAAPAATGPAPSPDENRPIRLVHHGLAYPDRRIEGMIQAVDAAGPGVLLDLVLVEAPYYRDHYRRLVAAANRTQNVRILPPVPQDRIVSSKVDYDLGLYILPPTNRNMEHCLPNKFFEFVQARLGVVIGPSPDMAALVREHGFGVVCDSFEPQDVARTLRALTHADVHRLKTRADEAARLLNFQALVAPRVLRTVADLLGSTPGVPPRSPF